MASSEPGGEPGSCFRLLQAAPRPREVTGEVNLLVHAGLEARHQELTRRPPPPSLADSGFLRRVVGDSEIRRGEGMELGQLLAEPRFWVADEVAEIRPLDLDVLRGPFTFKESMRRVSLPEEDRGTPTISGRAPGRRGEGEREKERHKRTKERDPERERRRKEKYGEQGKKRGEEDGGGKDGAGGEGGGKDGGGNGEHRRHKKRHKHKHRDKEKGGGDDHRKRPENGEDEHRKHKKRKHEDIAGEPSKRKESKNGSGAGGIPINGR